MRPHRRQLTRLPHPWDSLGKNTGVGCHFLLQCMKVKSESEVAQSCPTLSDPKDYSLPGSSVHGIFQARVLEWVAISFSRGSSRPRDRTQVSHIAGKCFTIMNILFHVNFFFSLTPFILLSYPPLIFLTYSTPSGSRQAMLIADVHIYRLFSKSV